jgi:hypothetical protein
MVQWRSRGEMRPWKSHSANDFNVPSGESSPRSDTAYGGSIAPKFFPPGGAIAFYRDVGGDPGKADWMSVDGGLGDWGIGYSESLTHPPSHSSTLTRSGTLDR